MDGHRPQNRGGEYKSHIRNHVCIFCTNKKKHGASARSVIIKFHNNAKTPRWPPWPSLDDLSAKFHTFKPECNNIRDMWWNDEGVPRKPGEKAAWGTKIELRTMSLGTMTMTVELWRLHQDFEALIPHETNNMLLWIYKGHFVAGESGWMSKFGPPNYPTKVPAFAVLCRVIFEFLMHPISEQAVATIESSILILVGKYRIYAKIPKFVH